MDEDESQAAAAAAEGPFELIGRGLDRLLNHPQLPAIVQSITEVLHAVRAEREDRRADQDEPEA